MSPLCAYLALVAWAAYLSRKRRPSPAELEQRAQVDAKRAAEGLPPLDWSR